LLWFFVNHEKRRKNVRSRYSVRTGCSGTLPRKSASSH
jgi:hypothetical protein